MSIVWILVVIHVITISPNKNMSNNCFKLRLYIYSLIHGSIFTFIKNIYFSCSCLFIFVYMYKHVVKMLPTLKELKKSLISHVLGHADH